MAGPLHGVKVLEFSEVIAGPFCGVLLADMGADVIKVEPPWGEPWRSNQPFMPMESRPYLSLNRGKRSLPLDLTKPEGREVVYRLVRRIDVALMNYRPDVPHKLGIDYETLSALNPRLVYCDNTGFGRRGPHSQRPGYDIVVQAMTGLMTSEGKVQDGVPVQVQSSAIADFATGIAMAWGVCGALYARERTGQGQKIETALLATALAIQNMRFVSVESLDGPPRQEFLDTLAALRAAGSSYEDLLGVYRAYRPKPAVNNVYYRTYRTQDGVIALGCLSDPLRKRMASLLGIRDIRFEPGYDPDSEEAQLSSERLVRQAEALFKEKTTGEWLAILDARGIPAGPVRFPDELMEDEQALANGFVVELEHPLAGKFKTSGPLVTMSGTPVAARGPSPVLGQHTEEILCSLGYTAEDVSHLRQQGITR
ncbi:MAG: CoA transferase [Chloroflexi bacterium]|nr:CoA transferase [Chloroflexota bacterium]